MLQKETEIMDIIKQRKLEYFGHNMSNQYDSYTVNDPGKADSHDLHFSIYKRAVW